MEAMQMGPAAFGPGPMRAGLSSGDHTNLSSSMFIQLGGVAADRLGNRNKATSSIASDLRTYEGEFDLFGFNSISQVKLRVGKQKLVTNMLTGQKEVVDTLFSNEGVPAETWMYEGEAGGKVYSELLDKYHQVASSESDITSVWISHRGENKYNIGRNTRIYKLEKRNDDVVLTSYTTPGSESNMWDFIDNLSGKKHDRDSSLHGTTAIFSQNDEVSHKKIFNVLKESLEDEEIAKGGKYLQRFGEEIEISDDQRAKIAQQREDKIKEKLLENDDVKVGLSLLANAIVNTILGHAKAGTLAREKEQGSQGIIGSLAQGLITIPNFIDHTGRLLDPNDVIRTKSDSDDIIKNKKTKETNIHSSEQIAQQIIEPVVAGIISYLPFVGSMSAEKLVKADSNNQQHMLAFEGAGIINDNLDNLFAGSIENMRDFSEKEMLWQEFIAIIFQPRENIPHDVDLFVDHDSAPVFISEKEDFIFGGESFSDVLIGSILVMDADQINEIHQTQKNERLGELKVNMQQGLEVIAELMGEGIHEEFFGEQEEEKIRQQKVESDVVAIGEEIIGAIFQDRQLSQPDAFARIAFLLHVYNDQNSSNELKHLLSALIYMQIKQIGKDRAFIDKTPQLSLLFQQFSKLSPKSDFLGVGFYAIIETLEKLTKIKLLKTTDGQADIDTLLKKVCVLIYLLSMRQNGAEFSPELLINSQILKSKIILPNKKKNKKSWNQFSSGGIIYQHHYAIAYKAIFMPE